MMKKITFLIAAFIFGLNSYAQDNLWPSEPVNTGLNSTYLVQSVSFDDGELIYGKIGAFFTNDANELQCGGWATWANTSNSIAVMGDDTTTPVKDGFSEGDTITWLATNDDGVTTYIASVTYIAGATGIGSSIYTTNSINVISPFAISDTQFCVNDANNNGICDENENAGCTDSNYIEYNPNASVDDGSCLTLVIEGCTDANADNYNSEANTDDGSCTIIGCMNEEADNYNPAANVEGDCIISGCTNETAFNYNTAATVNDDSCLETINLEYDTVPTSTSINYNIIANSISLTLGDFEISAVDDVIGAFQIINGELVCVGYNPWEQGDMAIALWEDNPLTPEVDGYVTNEPIYWVANQNSTGMNYLLNVTYNESDIITEITVNTSVNLGCTDETAFNYTDGAIEDGSCIAVVLGCMDENACGFDAAANTDDGSCYTLTVEISITGTDVLTSNVVSTSTDDVLISPTYNWTLNGNPNGLPESEISLFSNGSYEVTVTDDNGCQQTSDSLVANMSVNDVMDNNFVIYPNPANSVINITSNNSDIHSFELYNAIGELMLTKSNINSKVMSINRNELKSGIYISKITDAYGNSVVRNVIFE